MLAGTLHTQALYCLFCVTMNLFVRINPEGGNLYLSLTQINKSQVSISLRSLLDIVPHT